MSRATPRTRAASRAAVAARAALPARFTALVALAALAIGCAAGATPAPSVPPALAPGTYTTRAFQPPLTYTVPAGWWVPSDAPSYLALQPVDTNLAGIHLFRDPQAASQDPACPTEPEPGVGTLSTELAAWIRDRPGFEVGNPRMVTIGGLRGVEIDVAIAEGWTASCPFASGLPTVPLFVRPADGLRWVVAGSERLRLALLDVPGGGTVVVDVDAFDGALWESILGAAAPVVSSFDFDTP